MKQSFHTYVPLAALVALALFPFGWLAEISSLAYRVGGALFPNETAHAVGHSLLFGALGLALLAGAPALRRRPGLYLGLILVVALGQEAFQLLYKGRGVVLNDLTDIGTDLVAAGLVMALWYNVGRTRPRGPSAFSLAGDAPNDPAAGGRG